VRKFHVWGRDVAVGQAEPEAASRTLFFGAVCQAAGLAVGRSCRRGNRAVASLEGRKVEACRGDRPFARDPRHSQRLSGRHCAGLDLFAWESFGETWIADVVKQLGLKDVRTFEAPYGRLPDLDQASPDRDIVFTWNGTTSGVRVPNGDWIRSDRRGLTLCDATSAAFAMALPWDKLDVTTWSWQKALGGEAQHGMIALSPRAVERLESYVPPWPLPKIFRLTQNGKLIEGIFKGETINTPSMLAVEDHLDALKWAERMGGLPQLIAHCEGNLAAIEAWVKGAGWIDFLAEDKAARSCTSVCLKITDPQVAALPEDEQAAIPKKLVALLESEGVAYDLDAYRHAPPGLRIWAGATVDAAELDALFPWLDWAYAQICQGMRKRGQAAN
jgi:phosphoserine aminotransferase